MPPLLKINIRLNDILDVSAIQIGDQNEDLRITQNNYLRETKTMAATKDCEVVSTFHYKGKEDRKWELHLDVDNFEMSINLLDNN